MKPTRGQWLSFLAAWGGWVLDAFDFTIFLLAMPQIAKEFGVTITSTALTITLTLFLRLVGGFIAGALADRYGRKLPLMISIVWLALCDGGVALAPSFAWVVALRALFGLGMGAEFTAGATLAMENWPARTRGIASGVLQGSWALGYLIAGVVAGYVLPHYGYRTLFALAIVPALLVLPIRWWVPDSRPEPRADVRWPVASLMWASVILGLATAVYYAMSALYPTLLQKELGISPQEMTGYIALFNVGMFSGAIACGALATRSVKLAYIMPAVCSLAALPLYTGLWPGHLMLGAFLGGVFGGGCSGVTPYFLTSLFPKQIRARAVGLVYHIGACFASIAPPVTSAIAQKPGMNLSLAIVWVAACLQILLILFVAFTARKRWSLSSSL